MVISHALKDAIENKKVVLFVGLGISMAIKDIMATEYLSLATRNGFIRFFDE